MNVALPKRVLQTGVSPYVENVVCRTGTIGPGHAEYGTALMTTDETIKHFGIFDGTTTEYLIMCGTTKVWVKSAGAPVAKTPAPAFANVSYPGWEHETGLTGGVPVSILNNRGQSKPHYWNGGAGNYLILANAALARTVMPFLGRLFEGYVSDVGWKPNRIWWSDEGDITAYSGTTSGYLDLSDFSDPIKKFSKFSGMLMVYRRNSSWLLLPTGDPGNAVVEQWAFGKGIYAPRTLQRISDAQTNLEADIFLGHDDVYMANPSGYKPVGRPVREDIFSRTEPSTLVYAWSHVDTRNKEYYLVADLVNGNRNAWIFNFEDEVWTQQDLTGYTALGSWYE